MRPSEEEPTAADRAAADALAKVSLVDAAAKAAIAAGGLGPHGQLLHPHVTARLAAIHRGEGDGYAIVAVDQHGEVRHGPHGPMTASDIVTELLVENPDWRPVFGSGAR